MNSTSSARSRSSRWHFFLSYQMFSKMILNHALFKLCVVLSRSLHQKNTLRLMRKMEEVRAGKEWAARGTYHVPWGFMHTGQTSERIMVVNLPD